MTANNLLNELKQRLANSGNQDVLNVKTESNLPDLLSNWINNNSISADAEELPTSHESSTEHVRNPSNSDSDNSNQASIVRTLSLLTGGGLDVLQNPNRDQSGVQKG